MPQLDVSTYPTQLFWLAVCFVIFYFALSYVVLPRIEGFLKKREATVEEMLNKASLYREEAENLLADYEERLNEARLKAQDHYRQETIAVAKEMAKKRQKHLEKLEEKLHLAEQDLYRARVEAGEELEASAGAIANAILEKLMASSEAPKKTRVRKEKG